MAAEQSFKNHAALDPITHFILTPVTLCALGFSIYLLVHDGPVNRLDHLWMILASVALLLLNMKSRLYSLAVQDRVIRLEGRLRLMNLLMAGDRPVIDKLTTRQLIALRFASDSELPALAKKAATENLLPKQIKEQIVTWRPDHERI